MPESLRELSKRATPGPWAAESEKSDGSYGSGEDTYEGYDTATIVTEAEIRHGSAGVLFESHNSTVGSITEEHDDEWFRAWDEVSEANAKFIVALVNAYRSGQLHDDAALSQARADALTQGRREGLEEALDIAEAEEMVRSTGAQSRPARDAIRERLAELATTPAETQKPETGESDRIVRNVGCGGPTSVYAR